MHEMAYAEGILDVALDVAQGRPVQRIQVRAGARHGLTQDSLQFCFQLASEATLAAAAVLEVTEVPGDDLLVDAVELDTGWVRRPDAGATG